MKQWMKLINCILLVCLLGGAIVPVYATSISGLKDKIDQDKDKLSGINGEISDLEDEQDLIEEELADLDSEIMNTLTQIALLEEDIETKTVDIETTQALYVEAKEVEEKQYEAMVSQIQFMYEMGETDYLATLFAAGSFSEMLNQASYIEAVYSYDQKLLEEYEAAAINVHQVWEQLEAEKKDLESSKTELEAQKTSLDALFAEKKKQSDDFDAQIAKAKQEAKVLKAQIKQEQQQLKKLEDEERRKQQAAAMANGKYEVSASYAEIIKNASGSDLGKKIATYGCQFVGNPYVLGGTSLTKGADCSGFTYRIYSDFGYSIPRTSTSQRSAGTEVSYANAQPGDLICYSGHVGLYIGGGYIVHASSKKTGIKVSKATYRRII